MKGLNMEIKCEDKTKTEKPFLIATDSTNISAQKTIRIIYCFELNYPQNNNTTLNMSTVHSGHALVQYAKQAGFS